MFLKRATSSFSLSSSNTSSHNGSTTSSNQPVDLPPDFEPPTIPLSVKYSSSLTPLRRNTIGKGSTAVVKTVYSVTDHSKVYAVKEFHRHGPYEKEHDYNAKLAVEYQIVKKLKHPNVVHTEDLCLGAHHRWCHVMEYCAGGDLFALIKQSPEPMNARERNCLFKQLLRGVAYLHSQGVAHRDIKPENLLLTLDGTLKISDFGVSHVVQENPPTGPVKLCTAICGSEPYISPEVFAHDVILYDARALDIWSCAIVYFCMTFGGHPFTKADRSDPRYQAYKDTIDEFHKEHPEANFSSSECEVLPKFKMLAPFSLSCRRLLLRMLDPDPKRRCTIFDAVNDGFVNRIEVCCPTSENDQDSTPGLVDASDKNCHKMVARAQIRRVHSHFICKKKSFHA
ncbi:kinase-like domain-containing protein [Lipomyces tetrasporus]|uniref:non-specific serine/threonine protein kinase n=1 Tax=Lipomyces tetrasporus TaxID=54092 RepID=A0AAD7QUP5_9ASCO|nr:kinase-like domain-containing protein [Lipomyces tetrasporus]KAJ8101847.1 kinase-like domain-containing protein [Lipomyces tetrasporus]